MNKYIKTDVEQGIRYLKAAIMNSLSSIEKEEKEEIVLEAPIALSLIVKFAEERGWVRNSDICEIDGIDYWFSMITPDHRDVEIIGCLIDQDYTMIKVKEFNV